MWERITSKNRIEKKGSLLRAGLQDYNACSEPHADASRSEMSRAVQAPPDWRPRPAQNFPPWSKGWAGSHRQDRGHGAGGCGLPVRCFSPEILCRGRIRQKQDKRGYESWKFCTKKGLPPPQGISSVFCVCVTHACAHTTHVCTLTHAHEK